MFHFLIGDGELEGSSRPTHHCVNSDRAKFKFPENVKQNIGLMISK